MDRGFTLWFTGLSGSGKSTLAHAVESEFRARGHRVELLDGDVVRTHLSKGLGFSREDRDTNILRIGYVCSLLSRNGVIAISAAISPYRDVRDHVRAEIGDFVEVYVNCPLEECIRRDVKGLYQQALDGQLRAFTGVSDPYEPPLAPEITIHTSEQSVAESVAHILAWLETRGYIEPAPARVTANSHAQTDNVPTDVPTDVHANVQADVPTDSYSAEEEAEVSARLEALGYL
jgi:adenylylsulfate kinase